MPFPVKEFALQVRTDLGKFRTIISRWKTNIHTHKIGFEQIRL